MSIECECCDRAMPDEETAFENRWSKSWDGWICLSCETGQELCPCGKATVMQGHICDIKHHRQEDSQ